MTTPITNAFSSYTATLSAAVDTSSKSRTRVRTLKGALYDQEIEKESRITNAKKCNRKQAHPIKTTLSTQFSIRQSEMLEFAPCPEDPYESVSDRDDPPTKSKRSLASTENLMFKSVVVHPCPKPKPLKKSMTNLGNPPSLTFDASSSSPEHNEPSIRLNSMPCPDSDPPLSLVPQKRNSRDSGNINLEKSAPKISKPSSYERKRAKGTDVPYDLQGLSKLSIADYRSMIATHCPFPDFTERHAHAQAALTRSSNMLKIAIKDEESYNILLNLLLPRASHMRGELRTKLTPLVASNYGFKLPVSEEVENKNRALVKRLIFKDAFLFQEPEKRRGLYSNPILQIAINEMWFQNDRDEGVKFSEYFNPIPFPVIALIFTVVEFIIGQWVSGSYRNVTSFTAKEYKQVYLRHLYSLEATDSTSHTCSIKLLGIRKSLYSMACKAAGVKSLRDLEIIDDEDIAVFEQDDVSNVEDDNSDAGASSEDEDSFLGFGEIKQHGNQYNSDEDEDEE